MPGDLHETGKQGGPKLNFAPCFPVQSCFATVLWLHGCCRELLPRRDLRYANWEVPQARFGIKPDAIKSGDTPFFVVGVKNEAGLEGDAPLQAAGSTVVLAHYNCYN